MHKGVGSDTIGPCGLLLYISCKYLSVGYIRMGGVLVYDITRS
jgi:hypothetical protein